MSFIRQDVIQEAQCQDRVKELLPLNFGHCKLCLQVPIASGYERPEELVGKRIVTSFDNVANEFFKKLDKNVETTVQYISGSVEAVRLSDECLRLADLIRLVPWV